MTEAEFLTELSLTRDAGVRWWVDEFGMIRGVQGQRWCMCPITAVATVRKLLRYYPDVEHAAAAQAIGLPASVWMPIAEASDGVRGPEQDRLRRLLLIATGLEDGNA